MGVPTPVRVQSPLGRHGFCRFHVRWTQVDSDNLENEVVLSTDDLSNAQIDGVAQESRHRYAIEKVTWSAAANVNADLEFNSMPPTDAGHIMSIPIDATSDEIDFADHPNGCVTEPNVLAPGDVVLTTRGALPYDQLNLTVHYREKGKRLIK